MQETATFQHSLPDSNLSYAQHFCRLIPK